MRKLVKTLLTLSLMVPAAALALGLGEIKLHSALNQTLDADIELLSVDPAEADDIKVSLASAETFSKVGLQRPAVLMMVNFEVQRRENGTYYVKATSRETIREPFLDFLVEVEWPTGRVMREYTLLLDPPVSYQAEAPAVTTPTTTKAAAPMAEAPAFKPVQAEPTVSEPPAVAEEEEEFVPPPSAIPGAAAQAPAPAPEPVAKAAPTRVEEKQAPVSRPPSSLNYGVVKANDTLWEVALKLRPNRDISVQQVMMALQRANPDAFINNNINLLKKGYVLRIDDPALLTAMSKAEAARQVARQTREWEDYRAAVAEKAEERQPAAGAEVAAGTASAAKAEPKLKLVAPDDEAAEAGSAAEGEAAGGEADEELMLALESSAAQQKENETLQARVNELEEQLQDMQRLLALKDEDLATLQEQLAEQGETSEQAAVAPQEPEEKVGDEVVVDEAVQDSQAETDGEATTPEEDGQEKPVVPEEQQEAQAEAATDEQVAEEAQEKSAEEAAAESEMTQPQEMDAETAAAETEPKAAPAQPAPKADKPKPQPVAKPDAGNSSLMGYVDMLMKDPVMLAAGGGTIVLLLILTMLLIRRRSKGGGFQESILSGGTSSMLNAKADELDGETSFLSDLAISGMGGGTITTDEGEVDPLTEADVFMAYGRNQQAEEVLKKALEGNPERPELIAKLLEVYYNTGDKEQFEALINRSGDKIKGNDEHWSKIVPMGQALIPENALFGGEGAQATSPAQDSSQQSEAATDEVLDIGLDLDELTSDTEMQSEAADEGLDLGMDLELDQEEKTADEPTDDLSDLDFGLDLGDEAEESALTDMESSADSFSEEGALEMADTGAGAQAEEESSDLDFDLSGFDIEETEEEKSSEIAGDELADLDFGDFGVESEEQPADDELGSFDLGTDEVAETAEDSLDLGDLDFGDFDFDSGSETETATDTAVAAEVDSGSLELDDLGAGADLDEFGDLDDEGVLSDSEEMTTKLDLAQAYIEMGDNEGARSMLEEVAESGNDEQKQQAQELLSKV